VEHITLGRVSLAVFSVKPEALFKERISMAEPTKSNEEIAYLLTACILSNDKTHSTKKTDILALYGECLATVKGGKKGITSDLEVQPKARSL
jgi:hypothetical protein